MGNASGVLRQLTRAFEAQGINNPVQITEHIAFLLLLKIYMNDEWKQFSTRDFDNDPDTTLDRLSNRLEVSFSEFHTPAPPNNRIAGSFREIYRLLDIDLGDVAKRSDIGEFFQRDLRTELLRSSKSGQYPTPHHIAEFIASVVVSPNTRTVLDPTAGTGGLLVAAQNIAPHAQLVGIDYDPQWAGIGSANVLLNQARSLNTDSEYRDQFYLDLALNRYEEVLGNFDAVVMNPPFGGILDAINVEKTVGSQYGRERTVVLAGLALAALSNEGIAAFLLPSGALFGGGGALHLREELTTKYQLEAVITLPPDSFQPHSQVSTHLVVVRKAEPLTATWFCSLISDGYKVGAGRDITEPPSDDSELPRVRNLIANNRNGNWASRLWLEEDLEVQTLQLGEIDLGGVAVRINGSSEGLTWRSLAFPNGIMVHVRSNSGINGWFYESYTGNGHLACTSDNIEELPFPQLLPFDSKNRDTTSKWQIEDEINIEVSKNDISLKKGTKNTVKFNSSTNTQGSAICLFDHPGNALTPWMFTSQDLSKRELFSHSIAYRVRDATETLVGWLVTLMRDTGKSFEIGTMLIVLRPQERVALFLDNDGSRYALLPTGWLRITPDHKLEVAAQGVDIEMSTKAVVSGFAIGPVPDTDHTKHSVFGVLVPTSDAVISDMRPSSYLPSLPPVPIGDPTQIAAQIRHSQSEFNNRLESLLGIMGEKRTYSETSNQLAPLPESITGILDKMQTTLLHVILENQQNREPVPFNVNILSIWCRNAFTTNELIQQLRVFSQLGLIKEIHFQGNAGQVLNMYRLIINMDLVSIRGMASISQEPIQ